MKIGTLQALVESTSNNVNAIRLLLAFLVLTSHCFALTGRGAWDPLSRLTWGQQTLGSLAVDLFFFISGFLIAASWLRSKSMEDYLRRRIFRIYPAYVVGLVFSLVLAAIFSSPRLPLYSHSLLAFRDLFSLSSSCLAGAYIFPKNPFPGIANGSLWTISQEFYCYVLVAVIGMFGLFRYRAVIGVLFAVIAELYVYKAIQGEWVESLQVRFLAFFLCGVCAWLWRDRIQIRTDLVIASLVALTLAAFSKQSFRAVSLLTASYLVLWGGFGHPLKIFAWCQRTDLSYGVYLSAFPVQQALVAVGLRSPVMLLLTATPLVIGMAYLSWNFVERPFLALKSHNFSRGEMPSPARSSDDAIETNRSLINQ